MTNHVTKTETSMTKGIASIMRITIENTARYGLSAQKALVRMWRAQKKCHLALSCPIVCCSHQFFQSNSKTFNRLDVDE